MRPPQSKPPAWMDGHLDLAYVAVNGRDLRAPLPLNAPYVVALPELRAGNVRVALGTIFTELGADPTVDAAGYRDSNDIEGAHAAGIRQLEWYESMERAGELQIIRTQRDLDRSLSGDAPLGIVLLMECADPIRSPDEVVWWHERGVRVVGMSWVHGSRYAGGNGGGGGLTDLGRRFVEALDASRILHDVSHLSRQACDDLLACTATQVIASHSNAAALLPDSERHLTDSQVAEIAARDGWIGLNLYGKFLASGRRATLADCAAHVMHIARIAGVGRVGLGSDLDGFRVEHLPIDIDSPRHYPRLLETLIAAGFSDLGGTPAGFAYKNLERILRRVLPE